MNRAPITTLGAAAKTLDETDLVRFIHDSAAADISRSVLVLRRSLLPRPTADSALLRLVGGALGPLLGADRARLFRLPNQDLIAAWRGEASMAMTASMARLEQVLAGTGLSAATLTEHLALPGDGARVLRIITEAQSATAALEKTVRPSEPLDLLALAELETLLSRADMSRFARRRDVCAIGANERFVLRWEHRFLSPDELSEALAPERALRGDRWLFLRLTRTLDRRMMALLSAPEEMLGAGPFQLGLNVSSILSPAFLRFDRALSPALRGEVVLGLLATDILADPPAFMFAREFARARGYRLLLRSVTAELASTLPLDRMGLDLLELSWSSALAGLDALPAPPHAIVLARSETPEAISWGRSQGIGLYRGRSLVRNRRVPATDLLLAGESYV